MTSLSRVSVFRKLDCTPSAAVFTVHLCTPQNAAEGVRSRFSTALPLQRFRGGCSCPALCMQPNCSFRCRSWGAVTLQPNGCFHQPPPKRLQSECLPRRVLKTGLVSRVPAPPFFVVAHLQSLSSRFGGLSGTRRFAREQLVASMSTLGTSPSRVDCWVFPYPPKRLHSECGPASML